MNLPTTLNDKIVCEIAVKLREIADQARLSFCQTVQETEIGRRLRFD
jgi:hypothetical protein